MKLYISNQGNLEMKISVCQVVEKGNMDCVED